MLIPRAIAGDLRAWAAKPEGAVAQILVLDQFTRNVYRGSAQAFAGDARALAAARALVDAGVDRTLPGVQRQFVYLPFEHAEDLGAQNDALRLFAQLERDAPESASCSTGRSATTRSLRASGAFRTATRRSAAPARPMRSSS